MPELAGRPLFAYGTLIFGPVLDRVIGRRPAAVRAAAPGFSTRKMPGVRYPGLIEVPRSVAGGILLLDLSAEEFDRLDAYEGDRYTRRQIAVVDDRGQVVEAFAYLVDEACVVEDVWSSREFLDEHLDVFIEELDRETLSEQ
jgi:gamma-glutamylcyclotransferase (GGCT)/AIG2-like uncharacterized protein YtfP